MPKTKSKTHKPYGATLTWEERISKQLVGRKIVEVRWMTKEELVFLKLFMFDAWFYCDVRNYSHDDRKLFHSIKRKLSKELINA